MRGLKQYIRYIVSFSLSVYLVLIFLTETISRTDEGQPRPKNIFNKCGTNIYFFTLQRFGPSPSPKFICCIICLKLNFNINISWFIPLSKFLERLSSHFFVFFFNQRLMYSIRHFYSISCWYQLFSHVLYSLLKLE